MQQSFTYFLCVLHSACICVKRLIASVIDICRLQLYKCVRLEGGSIKANAAMHFMLSCWNPLIGPVCMWMWSFCVEGELSKAI